MKRLLVLFIGILMAGAALAQDAAPTVNWPYLYPDFMEGELVRTRGKSSTAQYNIHLGQSVLHYVEDGKIKEVPSVGVLNLTIGDDLFLNVGGKMMKVIAEVQGAYIVEENIANYSAVVSKTGAYGAAVASHDKTYFHERTNGSYNGYLVTDVYADLRALKGQSDKLPVMKNVYFVMGLQQVPANKKGVSAMDGIDKKGFSAFLKDEKIKWDETQDLIKVLEYITAHK